MGIKWFLGLDRLDFNGVSLSQHITEHNVINFTYVGETMNEYLDKTICIDWNL